MSSDAGETAVYEAKPVKLQVPVFQVRNSGEPM